MLGEIKQHRWWEISGTSKEKPLGVSQPWQRHVLHVKYRNIHMLTWLTASPDWSTHPGLSSQEPHSVTEAFLAKRVQAAGGWREQRPVQTLDVLHGQLKESRETHIMTRYQFWHVRLSIFRQDPHHDVHVDQADLNVEAPPVDRTYILHSSKRRHGDGSSHWQNWQAVSKPSVDPFLIKADHNKTLTLGLKTIIFAGLSVNYFLDRSSPLSSQWCCRI